MDTKPGMCCDDHITDLVGSNVYKYGNHDLLQISIFWGIHGIFTLGLQT